MGMVLPLPGPVFFPFSSPRMGWPGCCPSGFNVQGGLFAGFGGCVQERAEGGGGGGGGVRLRAGCAAPGTAELVRREQNQRHSAAAPA